MPIPTIHTSGRDQWTPHRPSGLTRDQVDGRIHPMEEDAPVEKGRYLFALLFGLALLAPIAAAALP